MALRYSVVVFVIVAFALLSVCSTCVRADTRAHARGQAQAPIVGSQEGEGSEEVMKGEEEGVVGSLVAGKKGGQVEMGSEETLKKEEETAEVVEWPGRLIDICGNRGCLGFLLTGWVNQTRASPC